MDLVTPFLRVFNLRLTPKESPSFEALAGVFQCSPNAFQGLRHRLLTHADPHALFPVALGCFTSLILATYHG